MRQSGYLIQITLRIPFDRKDPASLRAALADIEALEGASALCKARGVTMDISSQMTSWNVAEPDTVKSMQLFDGAKVIDVPIADIPSRLGVLGVTLTGPDHDEIPTHLDRRVPRQA